MKRTDAKLAKIKTYNTGNPCNKGHTCDRYTASGTCIECDKLSKLKPEAQEKRRIYGRAYTAEYYKNPVNAEKRKLYQKEYQKMYYKKNKKGENNE